MPQTCSVIIPTYNAERSIEQCIRTVRHYAPDVEIIVSDGGSSDRTIEIVGNLNVTVVLSLKGRGIQLNEGARQAAGEVLFFLHADTLITPMVFKTIQEYFMDKKLKVAKFCLTFDKKDRLLSLYTRLARIDSLWTSFGDQGIVVAKDLFEKLGGFPNYPLLEDVEFFRKARRYSRVHTLPASVITSAERFVKNGLVRQQLFNARIILKYLCGVSPQELAREYEDFKGRG